MSNQIYVLLQSHEIDYKLKDIIIENSNLRTDENLYEHSSGIAKVDIIAVLNNLVGMSSS